jgi:hypothetical protein
MRLLSALLDTVLLPVAIVKDVVTGPVNIGIYGCKSETRKQIEKIEDNLNG